MEGHALRKPFASDMGIVNLKDWRNIPALQNFSGNATYRRTFTIDPSWLRQGTHVTLDLGAVYDYDIALSFRRIEGGGGGVIAGQTLGCVLHPPTVDESVEQFRSGKRSGALLRQNRSG